MGYKLSIHMRRRASRILLEITKVRVEHLRDSKLEANGMHTADGTHHTSECNGLGKSFAVLWESIYGAGP